LDASPGLRHRHYAPRGGATLIAASALPAVWGDVDVGVVARVSDAQDLGPRPGFLVVLPDDPVGYARELFAALYRAERAAPTRLLIVDVPAGGAWLGVRDRLLRATMLAGA
jgi:L-threonylcarbamoyladenylate synthase